VKTGDLVKPKNSDRIGIIIEVFGDLDPNNPWVRVHWTHPQTTYEWCKMEGLECCENRNIKGDH